MNVPRSNSVYHPDPRPLVLTVPGLAGSGPAHWQSHWEAAREDCQRVNLGDVDEPRRNQWVTRLNLAIERARQPVVLAAHSLGCMAVAWWAEYERPEWCEKVVGALLVAPPDADAASDRRLLRFAPVPLLPLPFPSIVVASRNDPYVPLGRARQLAGLWGSDFVDAGDLGHINAHSGLGSWMPGQKLLARLLGWRGSSGKSEAFVATEPPARQADLSL
ncbi:RBBP9/YdeN family alpha/beta hydrolase [Novosphingobium tardum]|uniref:RBBP9/YdeN family alpha/beta hydrolase n=1 Tax=Novosphingobium tardum TaxID=1538021 RepID=A0ABV8RPK1_9SPHN